MQVRKATKEDIPKVINLYKSGLIEAGEPYKENAIVKKVVSSYLIAPCFLLVIDDTICGMAGLTVITSSHSGDAMLGDYIFYVEPKYRNIKTLGALVNACKDFAVAHSLPLRVDFKCHNMPAKRERLLRYFGFNIHSVVGVYNE